MSQTLLQKNIDSVTQDELKTALRAMHASLCTVGHKALGGRLLDTIRRMDAFAPRTA